MLHIAVAIISARIGDPRNMHATNKQKHVDSKLSIVFIAALILAKMIRL